MDGRFRTMKNFQDTRDEVFSALCESLREHRALLAELADHMRAQHSTSLAARCHDAETVTRYMIFTEEHLVRAQTQVFLAMSQVSEHFAEVDPNMSLVDFSALLPEREQAALQDHISLYDEQIANLRQASRLVSGESAQNSAVFGQVQDKDDSKERGGRRAGLQGGAGTRGAT